MNDYDELRPRVRGRTLLIVEGIHEKNELFWLIFQSFPEMQINMEDVWIYGTNIYKLYADIVIEYGEDWHETDIDLPFVLSKKNGYQPLQYKEDFINIILVFDYEHHDPSFSEEKILKLQNYFTDSSDVGQLYINYPMIESYQHIDNFPDTKYQERKISVTVQPGAVYKARVRNSIVAKNTGLPQKIREILMDRFCVDDTESVENSMKQLLSLDNAENLVDDIYKILKDIVDESVIKTAVYQMRSTLTGMGYLTEHLSYWQHMRKMLQTIVCYNINKANRIQEDITESEENLRTIFEHVNYVEILKKQNEVSKDQAAGFIWVLNTCVLVVADYNFALLDC